MKLQSTMEIATAPDLHRCAGANMLFKATEGLECLRRTRGTLLARLSCDLDPYLTAMSAAGTGLSLDLEWLIAQLDGHSKRSLCFSGFPTVDGSHWGLLDRPMSLLYQQKLTRLSMIIVASLAGELALFCDALRAII